MSVFTHTANSINPSNLTISTDSTITTSLSVPVANNGARPSGRIPQTAVQGKTPRSGPFSWLSKPKTPAPPPMVNLLPTTVKSIAELNEENEFNKEMLNNCNNELLAMQEKLNAKKLDLKAARKDGDALKAEKHKLEQYVAQLEGKIETQEELEEQLEELEEQLSQAQISLENKAKQITSHDERFEKLYQEKENAEEELEFEQRTNQDLQDQLKEQLVAQQNNTQGVADTSILDSLRGQLNNCIKRATRLQDDIDKRDGVLADFKTLTLKTRSVMTQRESERSSLEKAKKISDKRAKCLERENAALAVQIAILQRDFNEQSVANKELVHKLPTSDEERAAVREIAARGAAVVFAKYKEECGALKITIQDQNRSIKELEDKLEAAMQLASKTEGSLKAQVTRKREDLGEERTKNASELDYMQEQSQTNSRLREANDELKKKLQDRDQEHADEKAELLCARVELTTRNTVLEQDVSNLKERLAQRDIDITALRKQVQGLEAQEEQHIAKPERQNAHPVMEVQKVVQESENTQVHDIWVAEAESDDAASDPEEVSHKFQTTGNL